MITSTEAPVKKVSKSESGHANNVANFKQLTTYLASLGAVYNPSNESIKLPALQAQLASANNALSVLNAALTAHSNAIAEREAAFKPLSKHITRAGNSLKASGTSDEVKENAAGISKKLQGRRATPKLTPEEKNALAENGIQKHQVSASQMGFDNRIENLDKFVKLLASLPQYAPNEEELKIATLAAVYNDLKAKNAAATDSWTVLVNARIARNEIMYKAKTGLADIFKEVKQYLMSLDGTTGAKYKAISKLRFVQHEN